MASTSQNIKRFIYPVLRKLLKVGKNGTVLHNTNNIESKESFYLQQATQNNGKPIDFSILLGKKVLIVNTASDCGYTGQYAELQKLHEQLGDKLVIIGFPANDFLDQEKGNDKDIAQFCQKNYGVNFPIAKKGVVVKNDRQQPIFKWLTDAKANGWNDHAPDWNFSKYIIDEKGNLTYYFGPSISPLSKEFVDAVS